VYTVHAVDLAAGTITLRNPYGTDMAGHDPKPNDGYVTATAAQFFGYFTWAEWSDA
jgi:hypothetical protein